ncbi:hypothetical protein CYMTET_55716 [Cymbomonas tetramitiformis]|uniref:Uncharacterized protein n=1 Tax=Cymbomonas tetramitiformis TaxID=36881 RepID=A0AAE0BCR9_9CHLO|nr:hypothetical protein CYMTET_55716 [Cymbomonas tetramitiformis]
MAEDERLGDLFVLDDASITGTSDLRSVTLDYGVDPNESIMSFNAALAAAKGEAQEHPRRGRREGPVHPGHGLRLLSACGVPAAAARPTGSGESIENSAMGTRVPCGSHAGWRGCAEGGYGPTAIGNMLPARFGDPPGGHSSAGYDVMEILLALRKEVRVFSHKVNGKGFTPRAEKTQHTRPGLKHRFAASPLSEGGNWRSNVTRSDAVEEHAVDEYLQCCQPADIRFGVCGVGGALHINTFKVHDDALVVPPPPAAPAAPPSVVSDGGMYPVSMLHAHEPDVSFMDKIAPLLTAFGGVGMGANAAPPVGGAVHACPEVLLATASTFDTPPIDN